MTDGNETLLGRLTPTIDVANQKHAEAQESKDNSDFQEAYETVREWKSTFQAPQQPKPIITLSAGSNPDNILTQVIDYSTVVDAATARREGRYHDVKPETPKDLGQIFGLIHNTLDDVLQVDYPFTNGDRHSLQNKAVAAMYLSDLMDDTQLGEVIQSGIPTAFFGSLKDLYTALESWGYFEQGDMEWLKTLENDMETAISEKQTKWEKAQYGQGIRNALLVGKNGWPRSDLEAPTIMRHNEQTRPEGEPELINEGRVQNFAKAMSENRLSYSINPINEGKIYGLAMLTFKRVIDKSGTWDHEVHVDDLRTGMAALYLLGKLEPNTVGEKLLAHVLETRAELADVVREELTKYTPAPAAVGN